MKKLVLILLIVSAFISCANNKGELSFYANGEDFVKNGFVSKDGWAIAFTKVLVNIDEVKAYQVKGFYDADSGQIKDFEKVEVLNGEYLIDLKKPTIDETLVFIGAIKSASAGFYNAVSWKLSKLEAGPYAGSSVVIKGTASKKGKSYDFIIKSDSSYSFSGGEFVGDKRKGFLKKDGMADLELTFHLDHIFGDYEAGPDADLNKLAPGFGVFESFANGNTIDVFISELKDKISIEDSAKLEEAFLTLGHVGEGHCHSEQEISE